MLLARGAMSQGIILMALLECDKLRAFGEQIQANDAITDNVRFKILGIEVKDNFPGPMAVEGFDHPATVEIIAFLMTRRNNRKCSYGHRVQFSQPLTPESIV